MKKYIIDISGSGGSGFTIYYVEAENEQEAINKVNLNYQKTFQTCDKIIWSKIGVSITEIKTDCKLIIDYDDPTYEG